jgi:predicted dehydrogenase
MRHWAQSAIVDVHSTYARNAQGGDIEDMATITLRFADGSTGVLNYLSNGAKRFPKEEFTLFWDGKVARLDNFNKLQYWGCATPTLRHMASQQKGHLQTLDRWMKSLQDPSLRDDVSTLFEVSEWTIKASLMQT